MTEISRLTEELAESRLFIQHLENYNSPKKIIKIAGKIDFKGILIMFDNNFESLWERLSKTENETDSTDSKQDFRDKILLSLRQAIFNILYLGIKDLAIKQLDFEELNKGIQHDFDKIMQNLFNVFNVQYQLTLMHEKNTRKRSIKTREPEREIKQTKERTVTEYRPVKQKADKSFKPEDIPYYDRVIEILEEIKKSGESSSMRQVALKVAKDNMGLTQKNEIQDFYNRFVNYNIHKKKKRIREG
jgi:hypothetical protein